MTVPSPYFCSSSSLLACSVFITSFCFRQKCNRLWSILVIKSLSIVLEGLCSLIMAISILLHLLKHGHGRIRRASSRPSVRLSINIYPGCQLLLQFCIDHFETLHVFSSWYEDVHVVWIKLLDYFCHFFHIVNLVIFHLNI